MFRSDAAVLGKQCLQQSIKIAEEVSHWLAAPPMALFVDRGAVLISEAEKIRCLVERNYVDIVPYGKRLLRSYPLYRLSRYLAFNMDAKPGLSGAVCSDNDDRPTGLKRQF